MTVSTTYEEQETRGGVLTSYKNAPTRTVSAGGVDFAYRELGPKAGVPVIFLVHLAGNLDNWDPRVVDGIAAKHRVITFDNRGVGASTGKTPDTIQAMAKDAVTFIRALGFDQVDLHGFSMGGMIAQVIAQDEPELVRKLILTGTGPAGGKGMKEVVWVAQLDTLRGLLSRQDPKQFLFFTRTANGKREGKAFLARLQERTSTATRRPPSARTSRNSRPAATGARRSRTTSRRIAIPCSSRTAITTGCCRRRTPSTWPDVCRTTSW